MKKDFSCPTEGSNDFLELNPGPATSTSLADPVGGYLYQDPPLVAKYTKTALDFYHTEAQGIINSACNIFTTPSTTLIIKRIDDLLNKHHTMVALYVCYIAGSWSKLCMHLCNIGL